MAGILATAAAAVAAAAVVVVAAPPPGPPEPVGPQAVPAAERTVRCLDNARDAERINRRIERSNPGDEIIFAGPCLIDQTIRLLGNRAYRGQSRTGTVIKQADGANLDAVFASAGYLDNLPTTGHPFSLRTMTIDANSANNPDAHDAIVVRSWQTIIEDIQIESATRHGVRLTNLSADGTPLTNTQVNGRIANLQINRSGGSGVYVEDTGNSVTDWQLADNYIADTGGDGIHLDNAAGWMIRGNHIYGVGGDNALYAGRMFGSSITDNYIEHFGTTGIYATVQGDAASTISGNRVFKFGGGTGTFIHVHGNYANPHLVVTGNAIRGNGEGVGLDYQLGGAESMVVTSTGNQVSEVTVQRQVGEGVTLDAGSLAATDGV
jgi:hypothetical protein